MATSQSARFSLPRPQQLAVLELAPPLAKGRISPSLGSLKRKASAFQVVHSGVARQKVLHDASNVARQHGSLGEDHPDISKATNLQSLQDVKHASMATSKPEATLSEIIYAGLKMHLPFQEGNAPLISRYHLTDMLYKHAKLWPPGSVLSQLGSQSAIGVPLIPQQGFPQMSSPLPSSQINSEPCSLTHRQQTTSAYLEDSIRNSGVPFFAGKDAACSQCTGRDSVFNPIHPFITEMTAAHSPVKRRPAAYGYSNTQHLIESGHELEEDPASRTASPASPRVTSDGTLQDFSSNDPLSFLTAYRPAEICAVASLLSLSPKDAPVHG